MPAYTPMEQFFNDIQTSPHWYEELSHKIALVSTQIFAGPIDILQEEWLLKHNQNLLISPYEEGASLMLRALHEAKMEIPSPYSPDALDAFGKAGIALHLMQLSEHLSFEPKDLNALERMLLTSLFRQQLIFAYELQELQELAELEIGEFEAHLQQVLQQEIGLFKGEPCSDIHTLKAQELTEELFQYYCVRFEIESS